MAAAHRAQGGAARAVFELLDEDPDLTVQDIADALGVGKSSACRVVTLLYAHSALSRQRCQRGGLGQPPWRYRVSL